MSVTIWGNKVDVLERTNCPHCGNTISIYKIPTLTCYHCFEIILPDLRDITKNLKARIDLHTIRSLKNDYY